MADARPLETAESAAIGLQSQGFAVVPGFLPPSLALACRQEVLNLDRQGHLLPARVGRGEASQLRAEIRGDRIHWLTATNDGPATHAALAAIEKLRMVLNERLYLGLKTFECHGTIYPPGASYARHIDNFHNASSRRLSCLLYLNPDWQLEDGGALRLFAADESPQPIAEILPQLGTLACFLSAELPHEVLPSKRDRISLTGWFLDHWSAS